MKYFYHNLFLVMMLFGAETWGAALYKVPVHVYTDMDCFLYGDGKVLDKASPGANHLRVSEAEPEYRAVSRLLSRLDTKHVVIGCKTSTGKTYARGRVIGGSMVFGWQIREKPEEILLRDMVRNVRVGALNGPSMALCNICYSLDETKDLTAFSIQRTKREELDQVGALTGSLPAPGSPPRFVVNVRAEDVPVEAVEMVEQVIKRHQSALAADRKLFLARMPSEVSVPEEFKADVMEGETGKSFIAITLDTLTNTLRGAVSDSELAIISSTDKVIAAGNVANLFDTGTVSALLT